MIRRVGVSTTGQWTLIRQPPVLVGEMGGEPGDRPEHLGRRLRQHEAGAAGRLELQDPGDDIAYAPLGHARASRIVPHFAAVSRLTRTWEEPHVALHIDYYASLNSPWTHLGRCAHRGAGGEAWRLAAHLSRWISASHATSGLPLVQRNGLAIVALK